MDQRSGIPFQEGVAVLLAVVIACWLDVGAGSRVLLISSVMLVIVEILNSAMQAVVDRIGSEYHELSGRAKDMGSAQRCSYDRRRDNVVSPMVAFSDNPSRFR